MRSISNYALGLPEILVNVLQHLVDEHEILDARSLFACLQVSKLWFEEATTVLWSDEPPIQALAAPLKDPQFFANKILALKVDLKDCTTKSVLSRFRFPRLVEVDFQSSEAEDDNQPVLQCLQPRLKTLQFNQGSLSDDFLTELTVSHDSFPTIIDPKSVSVFV